MHFCLLTFVLIENNNSVMGCEVAVIFLVNELLVSFAVSKTSEVRLSLLENWF